MKVPIPYDYAIAYDNICLVSMIIPVIITIIFIIIFKNKKINFFLIPLTILFGIITFFIVSYYVTEYTWYDLDTKIFFNLFYIQLILLPLSIIAIYFYKEKKEKKKLHYVIIFFIIVFLILFFILNTYVIKIDPDYIDYEYSISITSENSSSGYIYIPFIRNNNYKDSIFDSINSENPDLDIDLINTKYGNALNISFKSSFNLHFKGKIDKYIDIDMYEWNKTSRDDFIWIFINIDKNDTLKIEFDWEIESDVSGDQGIFSGEISQNGWNEVYGSFEGWEG